MRSSALKRKLILNLAFALSFSAFAEKDHGGKPEELKATPEVLETSPQSIKAPLTDEEIIMGMCSFSGSAQVSNTDDGISVRTKIEASDTNHIQKWLKAFTRQKNKVDQDTDQVYQLVFFDPAATSEMMKSEAIAFTKMQFHKAKGTHLEMTLATKKIAQFLQRSQSTIVSKNTDPFSSVEFASETGDFSIRIDSLADQDGKLWPVVSKKLGDGVYKRICPSGDDSFSENIDNVVAHLLYSPKQEYIVKKDDELKTIKTRKDKARFLEAWTSIYTQDVIPMIFNPESNPQNYYSHPPYAEGLTDSEYAAFSNTEELTDVDVLAHEKSSKVFADNPHIAHSIVAAQEDYLAKVATIINNNPQFGNSLNEIKDESESAKKALALEYKQNPSSLKIKEYDHYSPLGSSISPPPRNDRIDDLNEVIPTMQNSSFFKNPLLQSDEEIEIKFQSPFYLGGNPGNYGI